MRIATGSICGMVVLALLFPGDLAHSRPSYSKTFAATYKEEYSKSGEQQQKCQICHEGENKKDKNNYGDAVQQALPMKNVKDEEALVAALRKVEPLPSAIPGKTFGDLIKEGRSPASKK